MTTTVSVTDWEARKLIHKPYLSNSSSVPCWLYLDVLLRHYWAAILRRSRWISISIHIGSLPDMWASIVRLNTNELNKQTYAHCRTKSWDTCPNCTSYALKRRVHCCTFSCSPSIVPLLLRLQMMNHLAVFSQLFVDVMLMMHSPIFTLKVAPIFCGRRHGN